MTDEEKNKIKETIDSICEILGINKPADIISCCSIITDLYNALEKENAELKAHCKAIDEMNEKMKNFQNCAHSSRALCPNGYKCSGCIDWELTE